VLLEPLPPYPPEIQQLFESTQFRKDSRKYNSIFALSAVGVGLGDGWDNHNNQYPNTLSLNGSLYHCIPSASAENNALR
jgi:hypothetical protein